MAAPTQGGGAGGWQGVGGAVVAAGAGLIGSAISAARARKEAAKQRAWAEDMYGRRYQMTMNDMRMAGLNPILAYKTGVGSVPSGARADVPDFGKGMAQSAKAGFLAVQEMKNLKEVEARDRAASWEHMESSGLKRDQAKLVRIQQRLYESQIPSARVVADYYKGPVGQWSKKWEQFRHDVGIAFPFTGRSGGARIK